MGFVLWTDVYALSPVFSDTEKVVIQDIRIEGNKTTKAPIILRELDFKVGDTLSVSDMEKILKENRNQVYNTRLFNDVNIKIEAWQGEQIALLIEVEERWYIIPSPKFELIDRNLNVWWKIHKRSLKRVQYGLSFVHTNFRGRKEQLRLNLEGGYTTKIQLDYKIPFIDRQRKTGIRPFIYYLTNKEVMYANKNNTPQLLRDEKILQRRFEAGIEITRRPDIHWFHSFRIHYYQTHIADTLAQTTPGYFLEGRTKQRFVNLTYLLKADYRDISAYPLNGTYFSFEINKQGIGVFNDLNQMWMRANLTQYFQISKKWYGLGNLKGLASFPKEQAFFNRQFLNGNGSHIRAYDLYLISAHSWAMARTAFKYELFNVKFENPLFKKIKTTQHAFPGPLSQNYLGNRLCTRTLFKRT